MYDNIKPKIDDDDDDDDDDETQMQKWMNETQT